MGQHDYSVPVTYLKEPQKPSQCGLMTDGDPENWNNNFVELKFFGMTDITPGAECDIGWKHSNGTNVLFLDGHSGWNQYGVLDIAHDLNRLWE
jgi:prepilin-type processing-associated H-X9-DG protein